jgi:outer membrane biosynthesis protein TonB
MIPSDTLNMADHMLIQPSSEGPKLIATIPGAQVDRIHNGKSITLEPSQVATPIKMEENMIYRVRVGDFTLRVLLEPGIQRSRKFFGWIFDAERLAGFGTSFMVHILLLALIFIIPKEVLEEDTDLYKTRTTAYQVVFKVTMEQQEQETKKPEWAQKEEPVEIIDTTVDKTKDDDKIPSKNPSKFKSSFPEKSNTKLSADEKKAKDKRIALSSGISGSIRQNQNIASLFADDKSINDNTDSALKNIGNKGVQGDNIYVALDGDGSGIYERGLTGIQSIGDGGGDQFGLQGGKFLKEGGDDEHSKVKFDKRNEKPIVIDQMPAQQGVGLTREVIQREIRKQKNAIRYCYMQELMKVQELTGKITIRFTIAPTGKVIKADLAGSTMNNSSVEKCVVATIMRVKFPEPSNGEIVVVTYPFMFTSTKGGSE